MEKHPNQQASSKKNGKKAQKSRGSVLGKMFVIVGLILFVMVIGVGCGFLTASLNTKPDLAEDIVPPASSQIYDINGNESETCWDRRDSAGSTECLYRSGG